MKIYKCDWCEQMKMMGCSSMTVDGKSYDVCAKCKAKIEKKLHGKGEYVWTWAPIQVWPTYPIYPTIYTTPVPMPTVYPPIVTITHGSGSSDAWGGTHTQTITTSGASNVGNTLLLTQ